MKLEPGSAVGRYRIVGPIGAGGMGAVYQARDTELGRRVAIKVIAREASQESIERMRREARAASALSHANAATVFDVGEIDGMPYIVMELVEGHPLRTLVGDTATSIETKLDLLKQVAAALASAHEVGLVHRDVKPENVMVRADGVAKLLDFGIAKVSPVVDPSSPTTQGSFAELTRTGAWVGSPAYMAPEQLWGTPVDGRADQFAWGVTAFEVFGGSLPWRKTSSVFEIAANILHDEPRPIGEVAPELPAHVCRAIDRCLAKDPGKRFADMRELIKALDRAPASPTLASDGASSEKVASSTTPPLDATPPSTQRRPLAWLIVPIALGGLLVGGWVWRDGLGGRRETAGSSASTPTAPLASVDVTTPPGGGSNEAASASTARHETRVLPCEDKAAQACAKDNEPWCDSSGKPLTCCVKGLVSTPQGRCVCAPGGVTNDALVTNGCARAEPQYAQRVQEVIRANFAELTGCYEVALKKNAKLSGDVSVTFRVAPGGEVYGASIAGSSAPDPSFQDCLIQTFERLRTHPPPDGTMKLTYPLAFSPQ